ncbi:MAG: hypothetical protein AB7N91_32630 [Candidatus Tectimicrobiota bacterium]
MNLIPSKNDLSSYIPEFFRLPELLKLLLASIGGSDISYAQALATRIKEADKENISSLDALVRRHPDLKDYTIQKAREKIKAEKGTYTVNHKTEQTDEIASFDKAVGMLKGLLDITSKSLWLDTSLSTTLIEVVKAAVHIDSGVFTRKCHDGHGEYETFPVKEDSDRTTGLHFNLAYVRLEVTANCVSGLFKDTSRTHIRTAFRVIEFRNFDSFFAWALDDPNPNQTTE